MIRLPRLLSCAAFAGATLALSVPAAKLSAQRAPAAADEQMPADPAPADGAEAPADAAEAPAADDAAAAPAPAPRAPRRAPAPAPAPARRGGAAPAPARRGAPAPAPAAADDAAAPAAAQDAAADDSAPADADAPAPDAAAEPAPDAGADPAAPPADGAAPPATAPAPAQESNLVEMVDNFWHYAQIARYDLSAAAGNRVLNSGAQPSEILAAFEQVASRRSATRRAAGGVQDTLDAALIRWQGIDPLREVATRLNQVINQGYTERVLNQEFIAKQIERLGDNQRAYENGVARLRQSGQYAVPMMVRYLRDPAKINLHGPIRNALRDLGRVTLSPLTAATETRDWNLLIPIVTVLGDIRYPEAIPYLVRAGTDPNAPDSVRTAVERALQKLNFDASNQNPADLFTELGEKYYYDTAGVQADKRSPTTPVWVWDEQGGLAMKPVSSPIFNEVMAMQAAEEALKIGGGQADAASLWLAANNKREAELPADNGVDTRYGDRPPAHFYNVAMGVQRLNNVLARALRDRNPAVALKAVRSLQGVAGASNMFTSESGGAPLVDALRFPDRTVRYEAAMAIAASLPQQPFNGQELVVPLLAEAVSQSGRPNVLVVVGNEAERSRLAGELKAYNVQGGVGANGALAEARSLPSVDLILVNADVPDDEIYELVRIVRETPRLDRTAKVILRNQGGGVWRREAINDPTLSVSQATEAGAIANAIEEGRRKTGGLPLDETVANEFALRAANHLSRLAISRGQVLDLSPALATLLNALGDPRAEIVKAVGDTVALIPSPNVQPSLLEHAQNPQGDPAVRTNLYRSLATSAKFYGSQLAPQQVAALRQTVANEQTLDVRSAAAEALGALNAPVQNVAQLITERGAAAAQEAAPQEQAPPAEESAGAEPAAAQPAADPATAEPAADPAADPATPEPAGDR